MKNLRNRAFTLDELEIISVANAEIDESKKEVNRVTQTIDRLISNLPSTIEILKGRNFHSLARLIQNDLDNLVYWQAQGGLTKADQCNCDQIILPQGSHLGMERLNGEWFYTDQTKTAAIKQNGCNCDSCCAATLSEADDENQT